MIVDTLKIKNGPLGYSKKQSVLKVMKSQIICIARGDQAH